MFSLQVGILFLFIVGAIKAECPCKVYDGTLTCQPGIINEFPEDLFKASTAECPIDLTTTWNIQFTQQPVSVLKNDAFKDFIQSDLLAIAFEFGGLTVIEEHAFRGLEGSLKELYFKDNHLTEIKQGALDNLVRLRTLDVRENFDKNGIQIYGQNTNESLSTYTTTSWNLCHRVASGSIYLQGELTFLQDLSSQTEELNQLFCKSWPQKLTCIIKGSQADCSGLSALQIENNVCKLKEQVAAGVSSIIVDFPADISSGQVEEFFEGESAKFFQNFNAYGSSDDGMNFTQLRRSLTLYGTKFDLASLNRLTSPKTEEVTVKADTIYITEPISIHYKLTLVGRVVAITQPITMDLEASFLFGAAAVEPWAYSEKLIYMDDQITLRKRRFGLIEILDENIEKTTQGSCCQPATLPATLENVSPWMDLTWLNLNYICGRTLLTSGSNRALTNHISNFGLRLLRNSNLVGSQRIFNAAQKFKRLNQQGQFGVAVHNVPSYSLNTIMKLSSALYDNMFLYRTNELSQEDQIFIAMGRMKDMGTNFEIVEKQQELYFDMEMKQLEAIWADSSTQWNFDFNHRNEIQESINNAINAQSDQIFAMQEEQYKEMLHESEVSVIHMTEVVNKYKVQVDRMIQKAKASMEVQAFLVEELEKNTANTRSQIQIFKTAAAKYMEKQVLKGFCGILKAFAGCLSLNPMDVIEGIREAASQGFQIHELMTKINNVLITVDEIQQMLNGIDLGAIGDATENMSMDFSTALKNAVDIKMKGPAFDEFESLAMITVADIKAQTDDEISVTELMSALKSVSDVGKRVVDEVASFADTILQLAERQDELAVAKNDLERAIEQVEYIKVMIEELLEAKKKFEEDREAAQAEYEAKIEEMRLQYEEMTQELREQYRLEISERFLLFKETFKQGKEAYLTSISNLVDSIHEKSLGLKEHSMNARAMILSLYADFCDTQFYHSFAVCTATQTPFMSDDFDTMLQKLNDIQWDTLTSEDQLEGRPIQFGKPNPYSFTITDSTATNIKMPVEILKNNSRVDINLYDYDLKHNFDKFWRIRLDMIRVILLDESNKPISSPGVEFGEYILVRITYPTIFNDTNYQQDKLAFLAQDFFCASDYFTIEEEVNFVSECRLDAEFTDTNYKPSPDGLFTIKLANPEDIDVQKIQKIKIEFAGSHIPRDVKNMEWIE